MGNLRSVAQALRAVAPEAEVLISGEIADLKQAERIVLPGQGAMPDCMKSLEESGLKDALMESARSKPIFGVCVGEQMLFDWSEEGDTKGLGLLPGKVIRFQLDSQRQEDGSRYKVPQMGWNQVRQSQPHPLWNGIADKSFFYFVHSFYAVPEQAAHMVMAKRNMARHFVVLSPATIFSQHNSSGKKRRCRFATVQKFLHWNP